MYFIIVNVLIVKGAVSVNTDYGILNITIYNFGRSIVAKGTKSRLFDNAVFEDALQIVAGILKFNTPPT